MIAVALAKGTAEGTVARFSNGLGAAVLDPVDGAVELWSGLSLVGAQRWCRSMGLWPGPLGVVGYDVLKEHQMPVAQLVDLNFGGCRMSVAVKESSGYRCAADLPPHCRVASKFTRCARQYFDALELPVELVHLTGSVELGPITGIAEAIVDLVATGRTLRDNGLIAIEDLFHTTARLVGHPLSMRLDNGELREIVDAMRAATPQPLVNA